MADIEAQVADLNKKLRAIAGVADNPDALLAGGFVVEAGAKTRAPVDTGWMRSAIFVRRVFGGKAVEIVFSAEYTVHVEYGTRFMPARPFIRQTLSEDENSIINAIATKIADDIERSARA